MGGIRGSPIVGSVKVSELDAMVEALPKELRGEIRDAMLMVRTLERERILMALPVGLREMH